MSVRAALDADAARAEAPRRPWTGREEMILKRVYPAGGLQAAREALPDRSVSAIYQRAGVLQLRSPHKRTGVPRQRYQTSEFIDAAIRRAYQVTPDKGTVARLAQTLMRPRWWVSKRATKLGLVVPRFKESPWTPAELDIVQAHAHRSPATLRRTLQRHGFTRTETAIVVKLKRLGADRTDPDHYTATGLADLMGVDVKTVTRWIETLGLVARRRGTDRTEQQGGDQWWIHRRDVRQFIIDNAAAVDLRKVDRTWFIDLLADSGLAKPGRVAA